MLFFQILYMMISILVPAKFGQTLMNDSFTGCKLQKAYTSLCPSCPQCVHHFDCFFLMHICIWCTHWVPRHSMRTPNEYMHEQVTIGIWCTHCGRKDLTWCTPFGVYSEWFMFIKTYTNMPWDLITFKAILQYKWALGEFTFYLIVQK